jgi:cytochrome c oxidase subunit 3
MPPTETLVEHDSGGFPPIYDGGDYGGGGDGDPNPDDRGFNRSASLLGLIIGMVASTMTFAALASTLVLRHALAEHWVSLPVPRLLWTNTALLLLSSVAIESARRALRRGARSRFNWLWWTGILLGCGFLTGQAVAWGQLSQNGIYLSTNPSHGLFYVLTFTHAAHAIGGLIALVWVGVAALRYQLVPRRRTWVQLSGIFWHFLDVMWLLLLALFVWWG